ncbi:A1 cistron-splicing factor [Coemansia spiralis]|nr:A1 cistron-splicing factor [Coemansia spiralis]
MDQNTAKTLFEQGATLVILDFPANMEFGIDLDTFATGPKFSGVKMIPPGIHLIHYSMASAGQHGMRCSLVHDFAQRELVVRKWDRASEQLACVGSEDVDRIRMGIRSIEPGLGAYPMMGEGVRLSCSRWRRLSSHITQQTIGRVLPPQGCFSSATGSFYEDEEMERARAQLAKGSVGVEEHPVDALDRFEFSRIDIRHSFPKNAAPATIRQLSLDKSWLLQKSLAEIWDTPRELLGEFQLAFLIIMVGQNFSGLEHWKRLMHLVLGSKGLLETTAEPFVSMLRILRAQLAECPRDFVFMVFDQDNFVASILSTFVLSLYECPGDHVELDKEVNELRELLAKLFEIHLPLGEQLQQEADVEVGEYAPQVVDL